MIQHHIIPNTLQSHKTLHPNKQIQTKTGKNCSLSTLLLSIDFAVFTVGLVIELEAKY